VVLCKDTRIKPTPLFEQAAPRLWYITISRGPATESGGPPNDFIAFVRSSRQTKRYSYKLLRYISWTSSRLLTKQFTCAYLTVPSTVPLRAVIVAKTLGSASACWTGRRGSSGTVIRGTMMTICLFAPLSFLCHFQISNPFCPSVPLLFSKEVARNMGHGRCDMITQS
jgi:hypothetical protein